MQEAFPSNHGGSDEQRPEIPAGVPFDDTKLNLDKNWQEKDEIQKFTEDHLKLSYNNYLEDKDKLTKALIRFQGQLAGTPWFAFQDKRALEGQIENVKEGLSIAKERFNLIEGELLRREVTFPREGELFNL